MSDAHLNIDIDSMDLRRGLERLPQELWDQIYTEVFTATPGCRPINYKPASNDSPNEFKLLHVSSATRALYAKTYYGQGATIGVEAIPLTSSRMGPTGRLLVAWLGLIPVVHRKLIERIVIEDPTVKTQEKETMERRATTMELWIALKFSMKTQVKVYSRSSGKWYSAG